MTTKRMLMVLRDGLLKACARGQYGLVHRFEREANAFDTSRTIRVRKWFQSLSPEQRLVALDLMDGCADMCLFTFATAIDGCNTLERNHYFDLYLYDGQEKRLIASGNPNYTGEQLHEVAAEVIKEGTS